MKTNKVKRWVSFFAILALAILLIYFFTGSNNGKELNVISVKEMIYIDNNSDDIIDEESKISYIRLRNDGIGFIIVKDSKNSVDKIASNSDYFFYFGTEDEANEIRSLVEKYNLNNGEYEDISCSWIQQKTSWIESLLPYLSVFIVLAFGLILIKSILGANSKSFNFGKTNVQRAINVKVKFSDVAGIDEEKEELQEVVQFLKNPQKFTELGAKIPKGILLVGQPGTGKTLLAKAIAGESNVPFFSISGSDFVEMFVGVGASRVRDLFEQAKKASPCIVFIDEIDAVGRQRGTGLGGGNDEREQTLNQLLVQMDGFAANEGIIVIAATNRSDVLDPALLRPGRFDRQIYINPPDVKGREMILKIHARNKPLDQSVDFKNLARLTSGFTGADLENLLNEAAILAVRLNKKRISMTDITESINKVLMGPQKKSRIITDNDKRITAFHESGHAIIGKKLEHCDVVQEVSIIPRGMAAGYTLSRPDNDESHMSYNKLIDLITMMLGGRVSEEIFIKDISTGAQNDIERATKLVRKMVTEWGMSSKLGPINYGSTSEVFLGRDYQSQISYSDKTASEIDEEIKNILVKCYDRAKEILTSYAQQVNVMSEVLLEKETIYFNEIELIMKGKTTKQVLNYMSKEEVRNKTKIEIEKAEADFERLKKDQSIRVKTAEALNKGGVITKEEVEKIKSDSEKTIKQAEEKLEELKAKKISKKEKTSNKEKLNNKNNQEKKQEEYVTKSLDENTKNVLEKEEEKKDNISDNSENKKN